MPWYKTGTVSVTQNSNAVIGTGTAFIANSRVGDGFRGPDGRWYEVTNIASNTALSISPNYEGPTAAGGFYAIMPVQGYQKDLSDQVREILNDYGEKLAALGTTGNYDILPPSKGGTGITDLSVFIEGLLNDADPPAARATLEAAKSGVNNDITSITGLTTALAANQGGTGKKTPVRETGVGYIDGLIIQWGGAKALTVTAGAAHIESSGLVKFADSPISLSGLTIAASTWYHVYFFDNSGSAAVEVVTTAPSSAYAGKARSKTGDSSRRYLGSIKSDSSGNLYPVRFLASGKVQYLTSVAVAPFVLIASNVGNSSTNISASAIVPLTGFAVEGSLVSTPSATLYIANPDIGLVTISNYLQVYLSPFNSQITVALNATQQFNAAYDVVPSGALNFRCGAYYYER